ncbi:MAG TPA: hypothetical protein EYP24_02230 [bacterium (Candidatus Stahlbacteria)]|nr:hypothetical protein [Candidatus Stahlbacteria bacterium]
MHRILSPAGKIGIKYQIVKEKSVPISKRFGLLNPFLGDFKSLSLFVEVPNRFGALDYYGEERECSQSVDFGISIRFLRFF